MNKKWISGIFKKKEKPHIVDDEEAFDAYCAFKGFHWDCNYREYLKISKSCKKLPIHKEWADLTKEEKEAFKKAFNIEHSKYYGAKIKRDELNAKKDKERKRLKLLQDQEQRNLQIRKQRDKDEEKRRIADEIRIMQKKNDDEEKLHIRACSKCLKKFKEGVNFCDECGGVVVLRNYCNKCKEKRYTNYCVVCGEKIINIK